MVFQAAVFFQQKSSSTDKTALIVVSVIIGTVLLPIVGFMFFVCGLGIFHLFLKCIGKSTREFLKKKDKVIPYTFVENDWCRFTPSLINFNYEVSESSGNALRNFMFKSGENIDAIFGQKKMDINHNTIIEANQMVKITPINLENNEN